MTSATDQPRTMRVPSWLAQSTRRVEQERRLDPAARFVDRAGGAIADGPAGPALRGEWLGHALHPLLTDLPLGCWAASALLDVVGGREARGASQRLIGLGLVMVPPTVAAGLVDTYGLDDSRARRV